MKYLIILILFFGCTKTPLYKAGQCIKISPFAILEITNVDSDYYYFTIHSLFSEYRKIKHKLFEDDVEKSGVIVQSCELFKE